MTPSPAPRSPSASGSSRYACHCRTRNAAQPPRLRAGRLRARPTPLTGRRRNVSQPTFATHFTCQELPPLGLEALDLPADESAEEQLLLFQQLLATQQLFAYAGGGAAVLQLAFAALCYGDHPQPALAQLVSYYGSTAAQGVVMTRGPRLHRAPTCTNFVQIPMRRCCPSQ